MFKVGDKVQGTCDNNKNFWESGYEFVTEYKTNFANIENETMYICRKNMQLTEFRFIKMQDKVSISKEEASRKLGVDLEYIIFE